MTQKRLNAVFVVHIRQDNLVNVNIDHLATELLSDRRSGVRFWYKHWLCPVRAILTFMTLKLPLKCHLMSNIITEHETV